VKVGGRRIELGEVEAALQDLPGVTGAAAAVRTTEAGVPVLVGYLAAPADFDRLAARADLAARLPAPMVPLLAVVDELPVRTSGKVDRAALPWPLPNVELPASDLSPGEAWLAQQWQAVLGMPVVDRKTDFFDLSAAACRGAARVPHPHARAEFSVADIYDVPRLGAMAKALGTGLQEDALPPSTAPSRRRDGPSGRRRCSRCRCSSSPASGGCSTCSRHPPSCGSSRVRRGRSAASFVAVGLLVFATPFGRMAIAAACARLLLSGVRPGDYPRGGWVHIRLWLAEQIADQVDAVGLAGAPWVSYYARALGARIGTGVDLHALPPITGMLEIGDGAAIEPEVDLSGYWIDGDVVRIGAIRIGAGATVGSRSTLAPGTRIGRRAEIAPGSAVFGRVRADQTWAGSAVRVGGTSAQWPAERAPRPPAGSGHTPPPRSLWRSCRWWRSLRARSSSPAASWCGVAPRGAGRGDGVACSRCAGRGCRLRRCRRRDGSRAVDRAERGRAPGAQPRRLAGMDDRAPAGLGANDPVPAVLEPVHARMAAPARRAGRPRCRSLHRAATSVADAHRRRRFLADDTMVASYELHGGWMRLGPVRIGKRAFLGNSGMAAPGHRVPRDGWSRCSRLRRRRPNRAHPGWARPPCVFGDAPPRATRRARISRRCACASPGRCGSSDDSCRSWSPVRWACSSS
jgi:acetyltransferase-like isoleucine patch superfamily enzyme